MEQRLTQLWYREAAGLSPLQPFSWAYGAAMRLRRVAYEAGWFPTYAVGKPVLVVGNLTVGGTGKTPLVAWLASELSSRGLKVGIVSRGYGRSEHAPRLVDAASSWREVGDEPLLLQRVTRCEIVVARDRVEGARKLVARGVDVVIADDGLQHLRLARECEIIVVDGSRGFGNGRLLPAGPLREPTSKLRQADAVVINGASEHGSLLAGVADVSTAVLRMDLAGDTACRLDHGGMPQLLEGFRGQRVHAIAGIGNPARFFRDLRAHGMEVIEHAFPDHHAFAEGDLRFDDDLPVLMTQKDAVRCDTLADERMWFVPVVARFGNAHAYELMDLVMSSLRLSSTVPERLHR